MSNKSEKVFKGVNWLIFVSWYTRIAGMVSFFILARYLDKSEFGIIAGCFVVQGFFSTLSNVGTGHYLIRKKSVSSEDLDLAWTINLSTRVFIALLIFVLSDYIAYFMKIEQLSLALKVLCLSPIFIGLINPALNKKVKDLEFEAISWLRVVTKTISTTLSLFIVIVYKTYWAVIISEIIFQAVYAIGSHLIVDYRPKVRVKNIKEQIDFSKWVVLKGIVSYVKNMCDNVFVSRSYTLTELGLYNFAKESSSTAINLLILPISSIFYPALSEYADNKEVLLDKVYKFLSVISFLYIPIVFGGIYLSHLIVPIVFGEKWSDAIPLFNVFLFMTFARCYIQVLSDVFILLSEVKKHFLYELVLSILTLSIVFSMSNLSLYEFAMGRVLIAYMVLVSMIIYLSTMLSISLIKIFKYVITPGFISLLMMAFLDALNSQLYSFGDVYRLCILIFSGAVFYVSFCIVLLKLFKDKVSHYRYLYCTVVLKIYHLARGVYHKINWRSII